MRRRRIIVPAARADRGRKRSIYFYGTVALVFAAVSLLSLTGGGPFGLTALLSGGAAFTVLFVLSIHRLGVALARGRTYWKADQQGITLECPDESLYWEIALIVAQLCAILLLPPILLFSERGEWMFIAAPILITSYNISDLIQLYQGGRPVPASITLTRRGVSLLRSNGVLDVIPWTHQPRLKGASNGQAVITCGHSDDVLYRMTHVPLTYRQLDRLLRTLSTDAQLRADLAKPKALTTVLTILEPTPDELTDGSWTWKPELPAPQYGARHEVSYEATGQDHTGGPSRHRTPARDSFLRGFRLYHHYRRLLHLPFR